MQTDAINNLSHPDPIKRRDAIYALARSGDPSAIGALERAAQSEAEPALRELEEKAVRHLQKIQSQTAQAAPPPQSPAAQMPSEVDTSKQRVIPAEVSAGKKSLAKGYVDQAITLKLHGKDKDAIDTLMQALATNPGLASDTTTRNLAAALIGSGPDEAVKLLLEKSQEPGAVPKKSILTAGSTEEIITLVLELILLFVIMVAFNALAQGSVQYGAQVAAFSAVKTAAHDPKVNAKIPPAEVDKFEELYQTARAEYTQVKWGPVVTRALGKGLENTLAVVLGAIVMYVVGILLGGTGEPTKFLISLVQLELIANFIYVVTMAGVTYVTSHSFTTPTIPILTNNDWTILIGAIVIGSLTLMIADIARIFIVARKHEIRLFRGFLCVFLGDLAFGFLAGALGLFRG